MQKSGIKRIFVTLSCILVLGCMLLLLAACSGGSSTPSSSPGGGGGQHQLPGYYIGVFSHEIQAWWQH